MKKKLILIRIYDGLGIVSIALLAIAFWSIQPRGSSWFGNSGLTTGFITIAVIYFALWMLPLPFRFGEREDRKEREKVNQELNDKFGVWHVRQSGGVTGQFRLIEKGRSGVELHFPSKPGFTTVKVIDGRNDSVHVSYVDKSSGSVEQYGSFRMHFRPIGWKAELTVILITPV